jgi:hypothetical protein
MDLGGKGRAKRMAESLGISIDLQCPMAARRCSGAATTACRWPPRRPEEPAAQGNQSWRNRFTSDGRRRGRSQMII